MHCHPISPALDLLGFLVLGLIGSAGHCVGMCSPFVLFVSRRFPSHPALAAQLWYTAGRILTYAALGAMAGAFGWALESAGVFVGVQRAAAILAGAVLVAWALFALSDLARFRGGEKVFARVARVMNGRVPGHPFATGLFLGLLPCGLLYSAVVAAVARGGAAEGATALAVFGLGTAPALLGISLADQFLARGRALLNRLSQVFILVMGGWFLWRGLSG